MPKVVDTADQLAETLESALSARADVRVGFLGESQVGKSSLINAVVGRIALPSGGIGPLTAQATRVTYAEEEALVVRYHGARKLREVRLNVEAALVRRGEIAPLRDAGDEVLTDEELLHDLAAKGEPTVDDPRKQAAQERFEYLMNQLWHMLGAGRNVEGAAGPPRDALRPSNVIILDGLRAMLGEQPRGDAAALEPYAPFIDDVRRRVGTEETITAASAGGAREFNRALWARAVGHLAPMVEELEVRLSSELLRGLTLVDLPGVGVTGDPGGQVARSFVSAGAHALVLVMRNNGLTDTIADMLERSGVITTLLFDGETESPSIHVMIAVTYLDVVAKDRYARARQEAQYTGEPPPDKHALFQALAQEMVDTLRAQVHKALLASSAFDELPPERKARREATLRSLCERLDIVCVAAPDFLHTAMGQEDLAFLRSPEVTGVPRFRDSLSAVGRRLARRREESIRTKGESLAQLLESATQSIGATYTDGGGRAIADWERFRTDLESAAAPLREQMKASHGELLADLKKRPLAEINLICKDAQLLAAKKLDALRRNGREINVRAIEAALRRDGRWERRSINYPDELTLRFVDSVATDWEPKIVGGIRATVRAIADRDLKLVERLCDQATALDDRIVSEAQIATQKQILQQHAKTCINWTKDRLDVMTASVRQELDDTVGDIFKNACKKALAAGRNRGTGARERMLDTFHDAGTKALEKACVKACEILRQHYLALYHELEQNYLAVHHDPLQEAFNNLTSEQLGRARRSDAQRRRHVLARVQAARSTLAELHF
ncbi:dynamin family protein [Sorangium sp. So ce394]|uniref:dynamin family protein n=1 Tax=Sorangium sp. So ce394 TaxID=3133310 RepID=UPI003F5C57A4